MERNNNVNYSSNMNRVLTKLKTNLVSLQAVERLTKEVAIGVRASNMRRVHNEGKAVSGSLIGSYSTKPMYVNPKNSPRRFSTGGKKSDKPIFKNGKSRKTKYFKDGYKGFRNEIGRETAYVNLQLTGTLKSDFNMVKTANGWSVGFDKRAELSENLEKKYNKRIWGVSEQDKIIVNQIISNFIKSKL